MKPVLRGFNGRRSSLWGGCSLSLLICRSLPSHTSSLVFLSLCVTFSLRPWIFMSQQRELAVFSPAEINGGVRSSQRPRGWIQTFGSISYCQRGADLFLSQLSETSVESPICDFSRCSFMQSFIILFFAGKHHIMCLWSKNHIVCWAHWGWSSCQRKKKRVFWWNHFVILQRCVFYRLFCTCSLHYMMLISFCFFFRIQWHLFHSCSLFRNE